MPLFLFSLLGAGALLSDYIIGAFVAVGLFAGYSLASSP